MKEILLTLVTAVAAYLLGCISTGTIVSRREGVNIRNEGSHNTGASNVLRVLGLKDGLITFLGDFAKAALACLIGNLLVPSRALDGSWRRCSWSSAITGPCSIIFRAARAWPAPRRWCC